MLSRDSRSRECIATSARERPDIGVAYPELSPETDSKVSLAGRGVYGRFDHDIADELLPPPPPDLEVSPRVEPEPMSVEVVGYLSGTLGLG